MSIDIEKIKRKLLVKYSPFGSIVANTNFIEDKNCFSNGIPTLGTDGSNIYYHPDALDNVTEDEKVFLFAHEICHIAFDHIYRSEGKDIELWNIATDAAVNAILKQDGFTLLKRSVDIPEAINYDAEQLYNKLLEEKNNNQNQDNSSQNNQSSDDKDSNEKSNKDIGHDTHSMWQKVVDKKNGKLEDNQTNESEDKKQPNDNQSQSNSDKNVLNEEKNQQKNFFDKIFKRDKQKSSSNKEQKNENEQSDNKQTPTEDHKNDEEKKKEKEDQIRRLTSLGEKEAFKQIKIERKRQLEELRKALASKSHGAGTGSDHNQINITDIGISEPLIDWRRLLKETVKYDIDWSYKNASIEDGVLTPYLEEIPKPETEILLDTSGSVSEILLRNFLRECKNILKTSKVKVGCFDDEFYGFTEIRNEYDIDNIKFVGKGGTNFNAAVNAFTRRVENKIIFTDGEASMPDKAIDAIWIVFGGKKIEPKGGRVIYIRDQDLKKLLTSSEKNKTM